MYIKYILIYKSICIYIYMTKSWARKNYEFLYCILNFKNDFSY